MRALEPGKDADIMARKVRGQKIPFMLGEAVGRRMRPAFGIDDFAANRNERPLSFASARPRCRVGNKLDPELLRNAAQDPIALADLDAACFGPIWQIVERMQTTADASVCFHHHDLEAGLFEQARRMQTRKARANHRNIGVGAPPGAARRRSCDHGGRGAAKKIAAADHLSGPTPPISPSKPRASRPSAS